jgi:hypothetical protein
MSPRRDRPSQAQHGARKGYDRHQHHGNVQDEDRIHMFFLGSRNGNSAKVENNRHPIQFPTENSTTIRTHLVRILHLHYEETDRGQSMSDGPWLTRNRKMNLSLRTFSDNWYAPTVVQHRTQALTPAKPSPGDQAIKV